MDTPSSPDGLRPSEGEALDGSPPRKRRREGCSKFDLTVADEICILGVLHIEVVLLEIDCKLKPFPRTAGLACVDPTGPRWWWWDIVPPKKYSDLNAQAWLCSVHQLGECLRMLARCTV